MNQEMLTRLHDAELEIMDELHRICEKYGIPYFLDSGTALGAIRHEGFIPWDDDIDVGMFRDDYEKFLEVAAQELSPRFFLQTKETEPNFAKYSAKIRMENTLFPEETSEGLIHRGIFIDVFPFDYVSDDEKKAVCQVVKARKWIKILRFRQVNEERDSFIKNLLNKLSCIIPERLIEKYYLYSCIGRDNKRTHHVTCYSYKMARTMNLIFDVDELMPVKKIKFEDRCYYIMKNPDYYLKVMYGDYMKLPPEEKRVNHIDSKVIFDVESEKP